MRCFHRAMVALMAVAVVGFSTVFMAVIWQCWRHPLQLDVVRTEDSIQWKGIQFSYEIQFQAGGLEEICIRPIDAFEAAEEA